MNGEQALVSEEILFNAQQSLQQDFDAYISQLTKDDLKKLPDAQAIVADFYIYMQTL